MTLQTVINSTTKRVLRSGYTLFSADGSFDAATEEVIEADFMFDPPLYDEMLDSETGWYWDGTTFTTTAP